METNMTNSYKATKTRHKYANRFKMISNDGARGECELMDDGTYRLRFGSMTPHPPDWPLPNQFRLSGT